MISEQRNKALRARRAMNPQQRAAASKIICNKIIASREFFSATTVACFLPMHDEVDLRRVIERAWRAKKPVFCPVIEKNRGMVFRNMDQDTDLFESHFGLWEPLAGEKISPRDLDLVLTPLVAFDRDCNRIGMGGGFYDRCFSFLRYRKHWQKPKLLGAAFSCQRVEKIDPNPWDIRLYGVCSEDG